MKPHRILSRSISSLLLLGALGAAPTAHAANLWDGGGTTDNWSDILNWDNDLFPGYGTLTFAGSTRTTNIVDASISMNQLLWTGASAWTLNNSGGAVISLFDNSGVQAKVENQSTGLVTINAPVTFAATAGAAWGEINAVSGDLTFGSGGTLTVNGSAVAGIKMFGAGRTTTFNGTVSAAGKWFATTAAADIIVVGGAFTSGDIYVMNGSTLKLNSGGSITTSGLRLGGDFGTTLTQNLAQGATFQLTSLTGGQTFGSNINSVTGNTSNALLVDSQNTSGTNTLSGSVFLDSPLTFSQAAGGTLAVTGVVSNASSLTKTGAGALTLSNTNTYTGGTFLNAGILNVNSAGALGNTATGALTITGGTLDNMGAGAVVTTAAKALNVNGDFAFTGTNSLSFNLGTATLGGAAGTRTVNVAGGTLAVGLLNSGAGIGLTKTGAGTLMMGAAALANTSTINGVLDIQGGKVQMGSDFTVGGLSGSGTIENGGTASKWLFVNNAADTSFSGTIQNNPGNPTTIRLGLVKNGVGNLTLSGANSVADNFEIRNGTVTLTSTGSVTTGYSGGGTASIGSVNAQTGVLAINGGTLNALRTTSTTAVNIGTAAGARGFVKMTSGTISATTPVGELWVSNNATSFGEFTMSGGTASFGSWVAVGRNGPGILNLSGGSISVATNPYTHGSFATGTGVTNISGGGAINVNSTGAVGMYLAEAGTGILNMTGGAVNIVAGATNGLNLTNGAGSGTANLNGGVLTAGLVKKGGAGSGVLNFNGGTLRPNANTFTMTGLTSAYVNAGGAIFDSNGFTMNVTQPLLAPVGSGVGTPTFTAGAGYVDAPLVTVSGGGGTGATAVATVAGGVITGITITNPGVNYTTAPTFVLTGGGATSVGTATAGANVANGSGGVTKTGAGTLTIGSTTSTYTGATTISAGTLAISTFANGGASSSLGASASAAANLALDGGTLQYTGAGATTDRSFTLTAGKTSSIEVVNSAATLTMSGASAVTSGNLSKTGGGVLSLTGTLAHTGLTSANNGVLSVTGVQGSTFTTNGGRLNAGYQAVGALSVGALTLGSSGGVDFDFGAGNDTITITNGGGLTLSSSSLNFYNAGGATPFITNGTYTLFDYTTSYGGTLIGAFSIANAQVGKVYSIADNTGATTLELTINDAVSTTWNLDGSSSWGTAGNWNPAGVPDSIGALVNFSSVITAPVSVTLDGSKTVGAIVFDNANSYTIAPGTGGTLTLNNGLANALVTVNSGSHTIAAPVALAGNANLTAATGSTLTISGSISGAGKTLTANGTGTVVLSGNNSYSGATTIAAGTLDVAGANALAGTPSVVEKSGAVLRLSASAITVTAPVVLDLGGGTASGVVIASGGTGNFALDVASGTNATLSGLLTNPGGGSLVKRGAGSLTLTGPGANVLSNSGGLSTVVQDGLLILNGGASATYGVTGEMAIGDMTPNAVSVILQSGTLNVSTFTSIGRGNGTSGLQSTLNVSGGALNTGNLFTGFAAGVGGYNAQPTINITGGVVTAVNTAVNTGIRLGESAGGATVVNLTGTGVLTSNGDFQIGTGGTAVINVTGTAVMNVPLLGLGYGNNAAANTGAGVIRQTSGTVQQLGALGGDWRIGGFTGTNDAGAYGSYTISGGTLNSGGRNFQIGAYGRGVMDISGSGIVTSTGGFPVIGRYVGGFGLLNVSGGAFNENSTTALLILGEQGTATLNVSGGTVTALGGVGAVGNGGGTGGIRLGHTLTGSGQLNLNGGTVIATGIAESTTDSSGKSYLYLNGGTLRAGVANATFLQGLDNAVVGAGGAIFDTNTFNVTVAQTLATPTGSGVTSIPVLSGGSGYLGRPIVQITGDGFGASALAEVDGSGTVTGITITSPGIGYTTTTVSLLGNGTAAPALLDVATLGAGTTGGLTKLGNGTLTLTGTNTFTGANSLQLGVIQASNNSALGTGALTIAAAATRLIVTDSFTIGNAITINGGTPGVGTGLLQGSGTGTSTLTGPITINALTINGGHFAGGGGTLVVNGAITSSVPVAVRAGNTVFSGGGAYAAINLSGAPKIGASNGLSTSAVADIASSEAATFDLNGFNQELAGLTRVTGNTATVTNSTGTADTLTLNVPGANSYAYSGVLAGNLALAKSGPGTESLSGLNTYTNGTIISGGVLNVNADTALGASGVTISGNATLQAGGAVTTAARTFTLGTGGGKIDTNGNTVTLAAGSTVTGSTLTKTGAGTLNLAGMQTYAALVTSGGVTNVSTALGTGTSTVTAGATTNFSASQTLASLTIADGVEVTFGDGLPFADEPVKFGGSAAVPEPGSITLLLGGLAALLGWRRRRA